MKNLLPAILAFACLNAHAQSAPLPFDSTRSKVAYTAVVQVPGATQSELYGRALKWLATLPATPDVPRVTDASSGTLAARVGIPFVAQISLLKMPLTLWRQVSVQVKDGRIKYDISDFACQLYAPTPGQPSNPTKAQLKLTPLEDYLNKSDWHNYTKDGQPRALPAAFIKAANEQSEAEVKSLTSALQVKSDW
jgi:hypothetical protein